MAEDASFLVVDDNPGDRLLLTAVLGTHWPGARLWEAGSLAEATPLLQQQRLDAVLLDLSLPDGQGTAVIAAVRAITGEPALVAVSGDDDAARMVEILHQGAADYLVKGRFDGPTLVRTLHHALDRHALLRGAHRADLMAETTAEPFVEADARGRVVAVNAAFCSLSGYSRAALAGVPLARICPASADVVSLADVAVPLGEVATVPAVVRGAAGTLHPVRARVRLTPGGGVLAFLAMPGETDRVRAALAACEARYHDMAAAAGGYLWETDVGGHFRHLSEKVREVLGFGPEELLGRTPFDLMPAEEGARLRRWWAYQAGQPFRNLEHRVLTRGGRGVWQRVNGVPVHDETGALTGYRGMATDITRERHERDRLRDREMHLKALLEAAPDPIIAVDEDGRVRSFNRAAETVFGYAAHEIMGQPVGWLMPESEAARHQDDINRYLGTGEPQVIGQGREAEAQRKDGTVFPVHLTVTDTGLETPRLFIGVVRDITQRQALEQELRRLAHSDPLTGCANRRAFEQMLEAELARADRYGPPTALLLMDLDHFKLVNDRYGHPGGDAALSGFVATVSGVLRPSDRMARLGGEEFALLAPETDEAGALTLAERLRQRVMTHPVAFAGQHIALTVSVGVAVRTAGGVAADTFLGQADEVLYRAKHGGRNRVEAAWQGP